MKTQIDELEVENKKMRKTLEYANYHLTRIWHSLQEGKELDLLTEIGTIGTAIENRIKELDMRGE